MFKRHYFDTLPYPISPNNVHLYKDQFQININVFSFFDDEGRARHLLVVRRQNYKRVANLLYWKQHYARITSIQRLFKDVTKHKEQKQFCLRCLGHFSSTRIDVQSARGTKSFAPQTTLSHCSMYFLR